MKHENISSSRNQIVYKYVFHLHQNVLKNDTSATYPTQKLNSNYIYQESFVLEVLNKTLSFITTCLVFNYL